jgi:hypothetical protein
MTSTLARCGAGVLLALLVLGSHAPLFGNDSAVETAAGGIQPRKETRISMEKERPAISLKKVTVEYEFLNSSNEDITIEVAFPIPPYGFDADPTAGPRDFAGFRVWVDGQEVKYHTEVRAECKGTDYTALLRGLGIKVQTFADTDFDAGTSQIQTLPKATLERLFRLGLIDRPEEYALPTWSVVETYHWRQRFPARTILHIRHEYKPVVGFQSQQVTEIQRDFSNVCVDPVLERKLNALAARELEQGRSNPYFTEPSMLVYMQWIKYILTTANTWKTPVKNFEMVVEEPESDGNPQFLGTGVCWDGGVQRVDKTHLLARRTNFIPTRELAVYYFQVNTGK